MHRQITTLSLAGLATLLVACAEHAPPEEPVTVTPPAQPEQRQAPNPPAVKPEAGAKARDSLQQGATFAAAERIAGMPALSLFHIYHLSLFLFVSSLFFILPSFSLFSVDFFLSFPYFLSLCLLFSFISSLFIIILLSVTFSHFLSSYLAVFSVPSSNSSSVHG